MAEVQEMKEPTFVRGGYHVCRECGDGVPWYYAHEFKLVPHGHASHPYCMRDRIDDEGCGPVFLAIALALYPNNMDPNHG